MSLLVVGSVALDTVETPFGRAEEALGGSATFFSAAASLFHPVKVVAVVGDDYPLEQLDFLRERGVDLSGIARKQGESFRWSGVYSYDLNTRETLETRLGVFAEFEPELPPAFRDARWVFLGNIDPELQWHVLDQVHSPRLVACDTMNLWIDIKREALLKLLSRVNLLLVNDAEARQLSGEHNLLRAARWIQRQGPEYVIVKKGEHGAILFMPPNGGGRGDIFFAPGFPLEEVFDPTGAGDSFAGGFMGWLAHVDSTEPDELRRAMIYGSALGSFTVERFGIERLVELDAAEIAQRVNAFREMTAFQCNQGVEAHAG